MQAPLELHNLSVPYCSWFLSQDDAGWRCGFPDAGLVWMGECVLWSWSPCFLLDLLCMEIPSPRYLYMILYMFKLSSMIG